MSDYQITYNERSFYSIIAPEPMNASSHNLHSSIIQRNATMAVAICVMLALTPFAINNLYNGLYVRGIGSFAIVSLFAINAILIYKGRFYPQISWFGTVPVIIFIIAYAIHQQSEIGALWSYPAILTFYFILEEHIAWLANAVLVLVTFPLIWLYIDHDIATRFHATILTVSIFSIIFIRIITKQQKILQAQAITDPLTGVFNRILLSNALQQAIAYSRRNLLPMTLLAIDIDHFKSINDQHSHRTGDQVLKAMGKLLKRNTRSSDMIFRLGGEEFLVLLHSTDLESACNLAEELRNKIATHNFIDEHTVTVSIGVASLIDNEHYRDWLHRSDENLYRAKSEGRNCVVSS